MVAEFWNNICKVIAGYLKEASVKELMDTEGIFKSCKKYWR